MCEYKRENIDFNYYNKCIEDQEKKQSEILEDFYNESQKVLVNLKSITKKVTCAIKTKDEN